MLRTFILLILLLLQFNTKTIAQINFNSSSLIKILKGKDAANLPANWMEENFSIASWSNALMPVRYGDGTGGLLLTDMQNSYSTVYIRSNFDAINIANLDDLNFAVNFDDGFVIFINGKEALAFNAPAERSYNSFATEQHESGTFENYILPARDINLKEGNNTISIQAFNVNLESSDFYFDLNLTAGIKKIVNTDSSKVVFSHKSGFYNDAFNLKLDVPDLKYDLLYTIDGSNPQTSITAKNGGKSKSLIVHSLSSEGRPKTPGFIVRASLKKTGESPTLPSTNTYIFIDHVINQTNPGYDWPTQAKINDQEIDLVMDSKVTQNPKFSGLMSEALKDLPSISIVSDTKNIFDPATGIYVNAMRHGEEWERLCSVELIDHLGKPGFNVNAGLRIRGGWSRHGNYPKHGFRLFFREEYGASKLRFPLFDNEGVSEFDKIDLRCEQNYSWANGDRRNTLIRDVFSRDTQRDMGQPYTRSRYYHLYLNGMYWGIFQTQERSEARYAESYFGGSVDDYDVVKVNSEGYNVEATDGNLLSWQKLFIMSNVGFTGNSSYFSLEGKDEFGLPKKGGEVLVDIDNLIDYMLIIFYTGNFDAPTSSFSGNTGVNNFYAIDKRDDRSTGFTFYAHDSEHSMLIDPASPGIGINENRVQLSNMSVSSLSKFHPQWLHSKLTSNKEYRQRFADRVYKHFFNQGVFTPAVAKYRFQKRADELKKSVIGESARWGDAKTGIPYTYDTWMTEINDVYNRFFPVRTNIVLNQLINANLYPKYAPPVFLKDSKVLELETYNVSGNYQIIISGTGGQIYYTLDGTDPRAIDGIIGKSAIAVSSNTSINLTGTSFINARIKSGNDWSALSCVKMLNTNENYNDLKITELHYNPKDSLVGTKLESGKSFEFIEFKNTGSSQINLSGLKFSTAIEYQFPENIVLSPGQFYVLASKPKWFFEKHFKVPSGNFSKNFSNSGEQILLSDKNNNKVIDFVFSDISPWPTKADGKGFSLTSILRNPTGNPSDFSYWGASTVLNGTPFTDDPGIVSKSSDFQSFNSILNVYPNPTNGILNINIGKLDFDTQIEILSVSGNLIFSGSLNDNKRIDFRNLRVNSGIYLLNIKSEGNLLVYKIVYKQ